MSINLCRKPKIILEIDLEIFSWYIFFWMHTNDSDNYNDNDNDSDNDDYNNDNDKNKDYNDK